ncbi:MAG: carboxypeptidase regulatory-like domain-containing protein [Candidatus Acidiferrales bacterium]
MLAATLAFAQQTPTAAGTIVGDVRSADGVAVPGATLRLTNTETHKVWVSWTDESGKFEFPDLPAGHYSIEASQLGFLTSTSQAAISTATPVRMEIPLRVATLAELEAQPSTRAKAAPKQNVGASQNGATNQSGGASGGARRQGRNSQLPPGVVNALNQGMSQSGFAQTDLTGEAAGQADENPANAEGLAASAEGAGSSSNSFLLQGTVGQGQAMNGAQGPGGFGGSGQFELGSLAPGVPGGPGGQRGMGGQFGQGGPPGGGGMGPGGGGGGFRGGGFAGGGGMFGGRGGRLARQAVNRVRFSFYDRYENSAADAEPFSITGNQFPKISHYDERLGGNLGGPLVIPHIYNGSDRTYFFVNYQHETEKSPVDTFSTVPTLAERGGDFCGLGITLYNPYSNLSGMRTPLGANGCQVPSGMIDTAAQGLLNYIPMPNVPGQTVQNYLLETTTPENTDLLNIHVLHTINSKFSLNTGYNFNSRRENTLGNFADIAGSQSTRSQNVTLGLSHTWSTHFIENTQLNWSRNRIQVLSDNAYVNNVVSDLGIQGVSTQPIDYGIPQIGFTSFSGLNDPVPSSVRNQTLRFTDGSTWVHDKHTLKFGAEIRRIQLNTNSDPTPRGAFTFTGLMTSQLDSDGQPVPGTGSDLADFLLGLPYNTKAQFGNPSTYFRNWGFVGYAQDDWRMEKRFTVQYGVRYEMVTPPVELYDQIANLDLNATATAVNVVTPGQTGLYNGTYPSALVHGDYDNWAPRIGIAWDPGLKPRTIVRAGYSVFYNESAYNTLAQSYLAYEPPFSAAENWYTSAAQILTIEQGFPGAAQTTGKILNTAGVDPFYRDGHAQIWMLGTETSFSRDWLLDLTYTGTAGGDLDLLRAPNRAPLGTNQLETQSSLEIPYATSFYYDQSGAHSLYNALQTRVVHRFTHGLSLQGVYTFGKSLDNASTIGGSAPVVVQQDGNYAAEYGRSSFDIRHQVRFFSVWELPFGERHRYGDRGWAEHVLGNWRLQNIITWQTGLPETALLGGTASDNGTGANFSLRAQEIGSPSYGVCGGSQSAFFNTAAFTTPPLGQYGDEPRGAISGPCSFSWNASLAKSFRYGPEQRHHVDVRWEVQNVGNHVNFSGVSTLLGSSTFGRVTSASSMRTMDVMLRYNF